MNLKIEDSVRLYGKMKLGNNSYAAQGVVLRSVDDSLIIGNSTWILENSDLISAR